MTKTKTIVPTAPQVTMEELETAISAYREVWLRKAQIDGQLKEMRESIAAECAGYFESAQADGHSLRLGGCTIANTLVSQVLVPEDMSHANDKKLARFMKLYPQAVKVDMRKDFLKNIDLAAWGIVVEETRKVTITVTDRNDGKEAGNV